MQSLENHFLIAMPSMQDPFFKRAVAYICEHNEDGAMGAGDQPADQYYSRRLARQNRD